MAGQRGRADHYQQKNEVLPCLLGYLNTEYLHSAQFELIAKVSVQSFQHAKKRVDSEQNHCYKENEDPQVGHWQHR